MSPGDKRDPYTCTNESLEQVRQDLERTIQAISHDLSEPLRAIQGYSQMLRRKGLALMQSGDTQRVEHWLTQVDEGALRLQRRLEAFRLFSRAGKYVLQEDVNLLAVLQESLMSLETLLGETKTVVTVPATPVLVWGHPEALVGVFQNLLHNAIKYRHDSRTCRICVQFLPTEDDTGVKVVVSDNGRGFDPKYARRVFELGFRLEAGGDAGTGFGLAIVRRTVEQHGGEIEVSPVADEGATFSFTLRTRPAPPSSRPSGGYSERY